MPAIVFGANGLLGSHLCAVYPHLVGVSREECDITDPKQIEQTIKKYSPHTVVNCAGIVYKHPVYTSDGQRILRVNSLGPKYIRTVCDQLGIKLIHISTDCVYDQGEKAYTEDDIPLPKDMYGISKFLGEIADDPHLTIRTSFVGYPDPKGRGLLHWLFNQADERVNGWKQVFWNGLTTVELSYLIIQTIYDTSDWFPSGLVHLHGETISKYELLKTVSDVYGLKIELVESDIPKKRLLLASNHNYYTSKKSFREMVEEMKSNEETLWKYQRSL